MKTVISASRRTDIPAYYLDRLLHFIRRGVAEVTSPYSGKTYMVSLAKEDVHTIVLWSKNFGPFLKNDREPGGYRLYFLFTINDMPDLEPGVPLLTERLDQLRELAMRYGPERIGWRFDPVVFRDGKPVMDSGDFVRIGEHVAAAGVRRTILSFLDMYGKVKTRNKAMNLHFTDPPPEVTAAYARDAAAGAADLGLALESCCEDLISTGGIATGSCIDGALLARLAGEPADTMKDPGQRPLCGCTVSRDIGSYRDMPCPGGCLYCYANPLISRPERAPG